MEQDRMEPLFDTTQKRYTLFPIAYPDIYESYKSQLSVFWTPSEIDFSKDRDDWDNKLSADDRFFITQILKFFAASDGIVMENLASRFQQDVQIPEARQVYAVQNMIEAIHSETYSLLIDTYLKDAAQKADAFDAIATTPCIAKKAAWAMKWIASDASYATRLVGMACVEGIHFSGAFCAIFWMRKRGLLPALCFSNELIARDETLHRDFAAQLYGHLNAKLSHETIHTIIQEAVDIEKEFILHALPCNLIGMNATLMGQYIEFIGDTVASLFGAPRIYNTKNPFDFMNMIILEGKGNFFEKRISDYSRAGVGVDPAKQTFRTDVEDF
jgi:ribonucleoside-diphosphate reductase subunit M2